MMFPLLTQEMRLPNLSGQLLALLLQGDLVWNFVTTAGVFTQTAVTPTTAGTYDWAHQGDGIYSIEIPASGGASINNDTEGFGWFSGIATGVLPWRGPVIGFRAAALNDLLIDNAYSTTRGLAGTALPNAAAEAAGGIYTRGTGAGQINQAANGQVDANAVAISGDSAAADNLESAYDDTVGANRWAGVIDQGTAQAATGTTLRLRSAAAFADSELVGAWALITGGSAGVGQVRQITGYVSSTDTATVDAWTTTPTGTITYQILPAAMVNANVTKFVGTAATATGGRPEVNTTHAAGTAWATVVTNLVSSIWAAVTDSSGVTTLLGKFTGITLLAQWLGLLAGKQVGNSTARTELRATGAGSGTYDETTDSQEAVRDNMGTLTSGERTAIANAVEAEIIDDTDSEKVLEAITNKIASVNPSLGDLTLSAIAAAVRDQGYAGAAGGSLGEVLAALAARLPGSGTLATATDIPSAAAMRTEMDDNSTKLGDILTDTASLEGRVPSDPADQSLVIAATDAVMTRLGAPVGASISADVAAVKADTAASKATIDKLDDTLEDQGGGVYGFTEEALHEGPGGGGGGVEDWTATERAQIRFRLGLDGTPNTPTATPDLATQASVDAVAAKTTHLPSVAAGANGGLPTVDGNNRIVGIQGAITTLDALDTAQDAQHATTQGRLPAALVDGRMAVIAQVVADKTGYALTSGERTAIANEVETQIIDDTDSEKVLQAIIDKIAAANPDLGDLTLGAIASAVRTELAIELGRIDAAVSSRLASAGYTAPPSAATNASAVRTELTTELGHLDEDVSSRATPAQVAVVAGYVDTEVAAILAAVNSLNDVSLANVKAALEEVIGSDVRAELTEVPAANAPLADKLAWLFIRSRNKSTLSASDGAKTIFADDDTTPVGVGTDSDDGTVYASGKVA